MSTVTTRMCDQCDTVMSVDAKESWMTLSFPILVAKNVTNAEVPEFDFCTYECLEAWVNAEDEDNEPEASLSVVENPHENMQVPTTEAPREPQPMISLADALASGLRPGNPV